MYDEAMAELIKIKNMEKEAKLCMKEMGRKHRKENKQMEERFERARLIMILGGDHELGAQDRRTETVLRSPGSVPAPNQVGGARLAG